MNASNASIRIAAMLAAAVMTTLTLSLQFGLARHYSAEAEALMAAKRAPPVAQTAATAARQRNAAERIGPRRYREGGKVS